MLTDAEIDALWDKPLNLPQIVQRRLIAKTVEAAVLAKLREGVELPEPAGFMWQHEETGRIGFADESQRAMWARGNPRLQIISCVYSETGVLDYGDRRVAAAQKALDAEQKEAQPEVDRDGMRFYKNDACKATDAFAADCICWKPVAQKEAQTVEPVCKVGSAWNSGGGFDVYAFTGQPAYGTNLYTAPVTHTALLREALEAMLGVVHGDPVFGPSVKSVIAKLRAVPGVCK